MSKFTVPLCILVLLAVLVSSVGSMPVLALAQNDMKSTLRASVKLLTPFDADPNAGSLCSGTMLNQEGYILTNYHCIGYVTYLGKDAELEDLGLKPGDLYNEKGLSVVAITDNPRQLPAPTYIAQALVGDSALDLAVLKIVAYSNSKQKLPTTLPVTTMRLADSDNVNPLDEVIVIGYPGIGGDTVTTTDGRISGFLDEDGDGVIDWLKTDVLVNQGNSGGSAVNDQGELIGIPTIRRADKAGNVIYLIRPTNIAVPYIEEAMKMGASKAEIGKAPAVPGPAPAPIASGKNFGEIVFGTGYTDSKGVTGIATTFDASVAEVHGGLPYANMRDGLPWSYAWLLNDEEVSGDSDLAWSFGQSGTLDLYLTSKDGFPEGSYSLQVWLRDKLAQQGQFVVGSAKPARKPQKPPAKQVASTGVVLSGTIVDSSTLREIEGAVIVFLRPGKTVDDFDQDDSKGSVDTVASFGITDANGEFTVNTPLPREASYGVIVGAKGYQRIALDDGIQLRQNAPDAVELDPISLDPK